MRKTLITMFMVLLGVAFVYGTAGAAVSGLCSDCHTMHDSQGGADQGGTGQFGFLTLNDCIGCHTTNAVTAAPQIDGTGSGGATSGGDVDTPTTDAMQHNILELNAFGSALGVDGTLGNTPPGGTALTSQLTCAGGVGCHGDPTIAGSSAGIKGFHHGTKGAGSYRFLYADTGATIVVNGLGADNYEAGGATSVAHNVYDADGTDSISTMCARCHTNFHGSGNTGSASPFTRHPTDEEAVIANIDGAGFAPSDAELNETPFGFSSSEISAGMLTTNMTTGTAYSTTTGEAMCLSCHRAHGTVQNDLLRFDYATMNAGAGGNNAGCETCHVSQR